MEHLRILSRDEVFPKMLRQFINSLSKDLLCEKELKVNMIILNK